MIADDFVEVETKGQLHNLAPTVECPASGNSEIMKLTLSYCAKSL